MVQRATSEPRITAAAFRALAFEGVPYAGQLDCRIERFEAGGDRTHAVSGAAAPTRRTICGPALMALADVTLYGTVLSMVGEIALAVTTEMTIHFLSRPAPRDVLASRRLLKLGRRLAVGEVVMHSDGDPRPICHVVGTYAVPPGAGRGQIGGAGSGA